MDTADVNVSEKELVISMDRVPCNTEYELKFPHFGPHTLILEYRCATEDVAQTPINVIIDNHVAASLCVQGNGGEVSTLARTVNLMRGKRPMKIVCDSPDVTIESFKLYK